LIAAAVLAIGFATPHPAAAGCGCQKPPPDLASVRPNATYAGTPVSLFDSRFVTGRSYSVTFTAGTTTGSATVSTTAVSRRDLADGVVKPQLVVILPSLPLGPTSIRVKYGNTTLFTLSDAAFTVVQAPIAVPEEVGGTSYPSYRAAIGRDGTFYLSLDMSAVTLPRVFRAQAQGYPLVFGSDAVTFYNIQGFLMQLLTADMPGLYSVISSASSTNSSILGYSRHEFNTFYLQHAERQAHAILDADWHVDGTRHVDHDHLILAIAGTLYNGALPTPGATAPFTLRLERSSLFHHGLVATSSGASAATMSGGSQTDGFDSNAGTSNGPTGDVFTNGTLNMSNNAFLDGNAKAAGFVLANQSEISGSRAPLSQPEAFLQVKVPDFLTDLGAIGLSGSQTRHVAAGSYLASSLTMSNTSILHIDNCTGPVTLYLTGAIDVGGSARIATCSANPEHFAVYVSGTGTVAVGGNNGSFYGVLYAPNSSVQMSNSGDLYGAVVGGSLSLSNSSRLHYDTALRGYQVSGNKGAGWEGSAVMIDDGSGDMTAVDPDALYVAPQL
jgi:hypothetical protein